MVKAVIRDPWLGFDADGDEAEIAHEERVRRSGLLKRRPPGRQHVVTDLPGEGPLGGILTALRSTTADWNLVCACDMPELTAPLLSRLFEAAEASDPDVLLPASATGLPEPLCAVWHCRALGTIESAFAAGTRKVTDAFAGLRVVPYRIDEVTPFQNVNTPEDWSGYAAE